MSEADNHDTCHILALGMDDKKLALLTMAIRVQGGGYALVSDGTAADVALVDVDGMDAEALWAGFCKDHPHLPAVLATLAPDLDLPAPAVGKPLRTEKLFPALEDARKLTVEQLSGRARRLRAPEAPKPPEPETEAAPPPRPAVRLPSQIDTFDAGSGLLGVLRRVQGDGRATVLSVKDKDILIVLPDQHQALALVTDDALRKVAQHPTVEVQQRDFDGEVPVRCRKHGLSSLLWQVALWTARGRLPKEMDINRPMRLRHWPNLTRMAPVPDALRMAAFLVRRPVTLSMTAQMLGVQPAPLFDFVSASYSIGVLEVQSRQAEAAARAAQAAEDARPVDETPPAQSGMLSRLLRKIMKI